MRFTAINERRKHIRHRTSPAEPSVLDTSGPGRTLTEPAPVLNGRGELLADRRSAEAGGADDAVFDDRLLRALDQLTEQARACLLLRTVMDLPYKEIALALDIPEGTAMSHVHRARHTLREALGEGYARDRGVDQRRGTGEGGHP